MPAANLGEFELLVLLACLRLGDDEAYAVSITDEITARTGRSLQRAAVYVTLRRLEEKGLISTHLGEPRPERGVRLADLSTSSGPGAPPPAKPARICSACGSVSGLAWRSRERPAPGALAHASCGSGGPSSRHARRSRGGARAAASTRRRASVAHDGARDRADRSAVGRRPPQAGAPSRAWLRSADVWHAFRLMQREPFTTVTATAAMTVGICLMTVAAASAEAPCSAACLSKGASASCWSARGKSRNARRSSLVLMNTLRSRCRRARFPTWEREARAEET